MIPGIRAGVGAFDFRNAQFVVFVPLVAAAFAYVFVYLVIYRRLVRFGARSRSRAGPLGAGDVLRRVATMHRAAASRRTVREANKLR